MRRLAFGVKEKEMEGWGGGRDLSFVEHFHSDAGYSSVRKREAGAFHSL